MIDPVPSASERPSSADSDRGPVAWVQLATVAIGAAGLGFSVFLYAVPYRTAVRDLKIARGVLMQAHEDVAGKDRELRQLRSDLNEAQRAAGDALVRVRSGTAELRLQLQEHMEAAPADAGNLQVDARGVMVRLAPEFLFQNGGATLASAGASTLRGMGRSIGKKARRVIVTAPLGPTGVPPEVAKTFVKTEDLVAERVRVVVRELAQAGVPLSVVWGVSTGGPDGGDRASVGIEIDPGA